MNVTVRIGDDPADGPAVVGIDQRLHEAAGPGAVPGDAFRLAGLAGRSVSPG